MLMTSQGKARKLRWAAACLAGLAAMTAVARPVIAREWQFVKVASDEPADTAIEVDSQNRPHVVWSDIRYDEDTHVYTFGYTYALWDQGAWQKHPFTFVSDSGGWPSMELDAQDRPHIAFYVHNNDQHTGTVRYATLDGQGQWTEEDVFVGDAGQALHPSLALDSQGRPQISHVGNYSYFDGALWHTDPAGPQIGYYSDLELDAQDTPHVASATLTYNYPMYTTRVQGAWQAEQFAPPANATVSSLELDPAGLPHIAWWHNQTALPVLSRKTGQGWQSTEPPEQPHVSNLAADDMSSQLDDQGL
ncbi:hypothetical protein LCGC14_2520650, partial [marine sediment metagenome]